MLKPEVKQQWVEALRSGEYPQGINNLRTYHAEAKDSYCCVGVLCDVSKAGEWKKTKYGYRYYDAEGNKSEVYAPVGVSRAVFNDYTGANSGELSDEGITASQIKDPTGFAQAVQNCDSSFTASEHGVFVGLAAMNDSGATFEEIADVIEKYL